jgi:hypothetical protein
MRPRDSQVFTVFGGAYLAENRGDRFPQEPKKGLTGKAAALLGVLLIGATTAVAATAISSRSAWRGEYVIPMQPMPPFIAKLPGTVGFEEALY